MTPSAYVCTSCRAVVAGEPAQYVGPGVQPVCVPCFTADIDARPSCLSIATDGDDNMRCTLIAGHTGDHLNENATPRWHWPVRYLTVSELGAS